MIQIQYGKNFLKDSLNDMWGLCFPDDTPEFRAFYFEKVYRDEETLILLEDNNVIASLQMIPYQIKLENKMYPAAYISGAMTHPDFQGKGYMEKLLNHAFEEMKRKKFLITFLIPQGERLFNFYSKHGYQTAFPCHSESVFTLKEEKNETNYFVQHKTMENINLEELYSIYSGFLNKKETVVMKTIQQFSNILEDLFLDNGSLFAGKNKIALTIPDENDSFIILKECVCDAEEKEEFLSAIANLSGKNKIIEINSPSGDFSHYWGMMRVLDESVNITKDIYMNTMLN